MSRDRWRSVAARATGLTGVCRRAAELSVQAHIVGGQILSDAAHFIAEVPVSVGHLDVDLLSTADHELYAQELVGALHVRRGTPIAPFALGDEHGLRRATEGVAYRVGLGVACDLSGRNLTRSAERRRQRRDHLWTSLQTAIPGLARR